MRDFSFGGQRALCAFTAKSGATQWQKVANPEIREILRGSSGGRLVLFLDAIAIFSALQVPIAGTADVRFPVRPMPDPVPRTLAALRRAEAQCTRCPLYQNATQVVPGEGPQQASLMMVGEQPGNDEDLAGRPFVGPAGKILDRAIVDAGLDRTAIFVTNAVKHFKFEIRGKRRLHKRPDSYEIERCKWWNDMERRIVQPALIVALGVSAARSLTGKPVAIQKIRGALLTLEDGAKLVVTTHPSSLLRIPDREERHLQYGAFVNDLRRCARYLNAA